MKLFSWYILCIVSVICVTAIFLCCSVAESRARRIMFGEDECVRVFSFNENELIINDGERTIVLSPPKK